MYNNLEVFQTAASMARHAGRRQVVVATNIANADTPGYVARSIAPFAEAYRTEPANTMRATRARHIGAGQTGPDARTIMAGAEPAPNGNAVTLEQEMLAASEVAREHRRAVSIYQHAMNVVRLSVGRK